MSFAAVTRSSRPGICPAKSPSGWVGDPLLIGSREEIVRTAERLLGEHEFRLVVQLVRENV